MFQELISKANEALNNKPLVAIDCALEIISQAKTENTSISSLEILELFCKATLKSAEIFEKDWNSDIVSSLFINKFSPSQKHFIAVSLIRLINANNEFLNERSSLRPQCFKLFDEILSQDLYKMLSINVKMQTHEKESKFLEVVSKFHEDFLDLIEFFKNLQQFPDIRHRFLQTINSKISKSLVYPFLPKELVDLRTQEIFSIIEKYLDDQGLSKINVFNEAIKNIDDYLLIAEKYGTKYSLDYLCGLARKIKFFLQKDFNNSPLSQPASLEIYANEKKYPFSRLNYKFNLNIIIKNNAFGQAFDVNLNLIEVSDNIRLDKREFYLGHIEITTIELEIPCEVLYSNQKAQLLGELIWNNFDNSKDKEEFELELEGQNSDIDWEKLVIEEPYSLEPVETEDELVGRKDVLDQLIRSASAKNSVGSSYILGQKRVGKTSIAKTLGSRLSKLNTSDYLVIYIEAGEYSYPSATETIRNLGRRICKKIQKADIKLSHLQTPEFKNSLSPLSDFLEEVINIIPEYRILFILDEFDELPIDTYKFTPIGQSFFLTLRAISSQKNFGFVLVGGEKMEFIISVQGDALNKFQPNRIDYFEKFSSDFQDLARKPVAKWGIEISDLALYELHQQTGGNPYFTKQICRELFKLMVARRDGHITPKEIKEATTFTLNTIASNSFIHFWKDGILETGDIAEQNSMNRRKILLALAETYRKYSEVKKEHIIDQAIKYGLKTDIIEKELRDFERRQILINTNDIYDCKVPLFAKWLRDKGVNEIITTFTDPDAILKRKKDEEEAYVRPEEILKLVNTWELYRGQAITDDKVRAWLNQFGENSKQRLMFKILQKVRFYQEHPIRIKMKLCERVVNQGLVRKYVEGQKKRSDILISYLDYPGKSGSYYAKIYADENEIYYKNVIERGSICKEITENKEIQALVFIDDFIGTGNSACEYFEKLANECAEILKKRDLKIFFLVVCGFREAQEIVEEKLIELSLDVKIHICDPLDESAKVFSEKSTIFSNSNERDEAKVVAYEYGIKLVKNNPLGYGGCQSAVIFPDTCPNNSLPILWSDSNNWIPLFKRQ